ncbi:MAG TPA: hypothetical protein PLN21_18740 [Gemmatales bacterium]|nr:hypothetical protein [Gemmatales bacterium]
MKIRRTWMTVSAAMICGLAIGWFFNSKQPVFASSVDRYEDFIMATGPVNQSFVGNPTAGNNNQFLNADLDGVWVLDYKSGKLLASTINRQTGKMIQFGEVDLVKEFEIAPRANVHFMMSTGIVVRGQSVLYLLETSTGKMGVYSMISSESSNAAMADRILIRRHDMMQVRSNGTAPPVNVQQLGQPQQAAIPAPIVPNQVTVPPGLQQVPQPPNMPNPANPLQQAGGTGGPNN